MLSWLATRHALLTALGALLVVLGLRFQLLRQSGSDLPFHDQWDAEALHLLRPWKSGGETLPGLLRFHNEHHPVLTKAINLGLAKFSGMWSALPQLLVNTLLQGGVLLLLARLGRRHLAPRASWLFTTAAAVLLASPLLWENLLWGFQSQFTLAVLLGLLHLDLTWSEPRLGWRWGLGALAGVLTLGTIASGFLAVTVSGLVALPRLFRPGPPRTHAITTVLLAALLTVVGFAIIRPVPYSAVATNLFSALEAFLTFTAWPFPPGLASILLPLPALLRLCRNLFDRSPSTTRSWLIAVVLWLLAITAAFAVGRAALLNGVTPRYRDILAIQLLVGFVCALQLAATARHRWLAGSAAALWGVTVGFAWQAEWRGENLANDLQYRADLQSAQQRLVRAYLIDGQTEILTSPSLAARLLHDSPEQRVTLLNDAGVRALLPPSVRAPLSVSVSSPDRTLTRLPFKLGDALTPGWTVTPDYQKGAHLLSDWIEPETFPLLRIRMKGGLDGQDHQLRLLVGEAARVVEPLGLTDGLAAQTINFPMPREKFRLQAIAAPLSPVLTFSDPVSTNQVDRFTNKLLGLGGPLTIAGVALLGLTGLLVWWRPTENHPARVEPIDLEPVRLRRLLATLALVSLSAVFALWPEPLVWSNESRAALLLQPERWSAQAIPAFTLLPSATGESVTPGAIYAGLLTREKLHGTYGQQGDATTASTLSAPFPLTARYFLLPIVGYPAQPANTLALETFHEDMILDAIRYGAANPGERLRLWHMDLAEIQGSSVRLRVIDGEVGHAGWFGLATPWLTDDSTAAAAWQRLADSNRLLWLRPVLLVLGLACALAWWRLNRHSTRPPAVPTHPDSPPQPSPAIR